MPLVERRYAEALVDVAEKLGSIDAFQQELEAVTDIYEKECDLKAFLLNPEIKLEVKKEAVKGIFEGKVKNELLNFVLLILDKGRMKLLPGIRSEFVSMADKKRNILSMTIISAAPIDEKQINEIKEKYKRLYSAADAKVNTEVDASLIGGVQVIIGDKVVDGSIVGRLESLKKSLLRS